MVCIEKCATEGRNHDHIDEINRLDVHRDTISIVVADDGSDREVEFFGTVANDCEVRHKGLPRIGKDGATLMVCCESGP